MFLSAMSACMSVIRPRRYERRHGDFSDRHTVEANALGVALSNLAQTYVPAALTVTDRAAEKIRRLIDDEGNPTLKLRVFVAGGGCSGFQYGFRLDEVLSDDDTLIEVNGAAVLVDALSIQYLTGSLLDYSEGLEGARFTVTNPNAVATCGCGASFSI